MKLAEILIPASNPAALGYVVFSGEVGVFMRTTFQQINNLATAPQIVRHSIPDYQALWASIF